MLLGVVAQLEAVPGRDDAGVGLVDPAEDPQQGGLARAVEPEDDHPGALVDRQVDVGEDLEGAVRLRQLRGRERRLAAGRRGGELDLGHPVGAALGLDAGHQLLGALEHRLRGLRLGRLGAHLVGLVGQGLGLVLGVDPLPLAALLVGLALLEVGLPAHVVDVDLGPVRVEVQHPVDGGVEQGGVVADHHQAALVRDQEVAQPHDRVGVEVVGRLVEQQRLGAAEEDPGQLDPAALASRQGAQRLAEDPVLDAQAVRDLGRLRLRGVAAAGVQLGVGLAVAAHRAVADGVVLAAHLHLGLAQPADHVAESAGGQDPVAGQQLGVAGARVLRQVADLAGRGDCPAAGSASPARILVRVVLPAPLRPTRPILSPAATRKLRPVHQEPRPGADLEVRGR